MTTGAAAAAPALLLVDDDETALRALESALRRRLPEYRFFSATTSAEALAVVGADSLSACIVDLSLDPSMGPEGGLQLVSEILAVDPATRVLVLTGHGGDEYGIRSLNAGAASFLVKPVVYDHLVPLIRDAVVTSALRRRILAADRWDGGCKRIGELSSRSAAMIPILDQIAYTVSTKQPVLLLGETGVGKGVVASTIHRAQFGNDAPFIRFQPGLHGGDLIASELFGHQRGAFTGAVENRRGLLEEADGGTLFIDEVDELPSAVQVLLLNALQERTFRRVGTNNERRSEFRLISASNRSLAESLRTGKLRQDFYHRIAHGVIEIPPLRDRPEDIIDLSLHRLTEIATRERLRVHGIAPAARKLLAEHRWPGNVRELHAVIESAVYRANFAERSIVEPEDLLFTKSPFAVEDPSIETAANIQRSSTATMHPAPSDAPFRDQVERFELRLIREALERCGNNQSRAAELLKLDRSTMRRILGRTHEKPKQ